jgi:hypothetical protein
MLDAFRKTDECFVFWTSLLTILFTMEALEMLQGGIHGKAVMVGKGMTVYPLQSAVTAVAQPLNNVLIGDTGGMESGSHMMTVIMQAAMREAVPLQKSGMA